MSIKTFKRLVVTGTMAFGALLVGCDDDAADGASDAGGDSAAGDSSVADTGAADASAPDATADGAADTGTDAGDGTITCGTETCEGFTLITTNIPPCCAGEDKDVCGIDADAIQKVNPDSAFTGCMIKDAPGVQSDVAGVFFDQVASDDRVELDADCAPPTTENGVFDIHSSTLMLNLEFGGCCTPEGQYGVNLSASINVPEVNSHFGCLGFEALAASLAPGGANEAPCKDEKDAIDALDADPMMKRNAGVLPFCDPATGDQGCPPILSTTLCEQLKGMGLPFTCTGDMDTPAWVCHATQLDPTVVLDPGYCMEGIPAFLNGCGAVTAATCVPGVPATVFGCDPLPDGNVVPGIPSALCGCGTGSFPTMDPIECIPNVGDAVCGAE